MLQLKSVHYVIHKRLEGNNGTSVLFRGSRNKVGGKKIDERVENTKPTLSLGFRRVKKRGSGRRGS